MWHSYDILKNIKKGDVAYSCPFFFLKIGSKIDRFELEVVSNNSSNISVWPSTTWTSPPKMTTATEI